MKKMLILDFDHTISNSRAFAKECMQILLITKEQYYEQLENLADDQRLDDIRNRLSTFRFSGVDKLLEEMRESFDMCVLITKAGYSLRWQNSVIESSKLIPYFDKVLVTEDSKVGLVEKLHRENPNHHITFVNDIYSHEPENDMIKNLLPDTTVVSIDNYSEGGYTTNNFYESLQ